MSLNLSIGGNEKKGKNSGFFVEPAVVADVKLSMKVAQEEIFGPIAAIIKYEKKKSFFPLYNFTFVDLKLKMKQLKSLIQLMLV